MRLWETPVPIPNTTVKTQSAGDTWLETARENRWLPDSIILNSSVVEQPAVNRWVAGSSPAWGALIIRPNGQAVKTRPFHGCNPGSIPGWVILIYADVAQLAEQLTCNQQVNGSSPFIGFFFWVFSSVGQSIRLITWRSRVQVPEDPLIIFIWLSSSVG